MSTPQKYLAMSKAGHDKGKLYVVLKEEDGCCVLVNGTSKTMNAPKRKKKIHLQKIIHVGAALKEQLDRMCTDEDAARVLCTYQMRHTTNTEHLKYDIDNQGGNACQRQM